jgi:hypothetical protein
MTIHPDGLKYRRPYTLDRDPTIVPRHDHGAYIRGWVEMLDWREIGLHGFPDNPYSRHYFFNHHYSFKAGVQDAYQFLITDAP